MRYAGVGVVNGNFFSALKKNYDTFSLFYPDFQQFCYGFQPTIIVTHPLSYLRRFIQKQLHGYSSNHKKGILSS